ncbi:MAG: type II toxin-antitoxin system Phd/YefM family antitoxin [Acidobacteria bacterium]|nr:type II toxin-antitoxin system Phd/YefM family antitoxin [Acidobacteriota bacterium]
MAKGNWTVAEAKAKFSEVLERAEKEGPQRITKHGRERAVVVSLQDWKKKGERKAKKKGNLAEFFLNSPLRNSGVVIEERSKASRNVEL